MSSRHSSCSSSGGAAAPTGFAGARHTLFLRVHSADKLSLATSLASYAKVYVGDTPVVSSSANMATLLNDNSHPEHRVFTTRTTASKLKTTALWNEKFEVPLENIKTQILSLRVKSQHQLYSPSIGACAIPLKQLKVGATIDQNFPLFKGSSQVGAIRLQMVIRDNFPGRSSDADVAASDDKNRKKMTLATGRTREDVDSEAARRCERLAREQAERDEEERQRRLRDQLEQERKRIEAEMERLRREEEERTRRKFEEEERRLVEEQQRFAAERALEEERRHKEQARLEEAALVQKLLAESRARKKSKSLAASENQRGEDDDDDDNDNGTSRTSRTSSSLTVLTADDNAGEEGKPLRVAAESAPELKACASSRVSASSRRRATMLLRDIIDEVVQDALPSDDSDSSDAELDTEDEHEFIRKMAKLKLKLLKRKRLRRAMQDDSRRSTLVVLDKTATDPCEPVTHAARKSVSKSERKKKKTRRKSYASSTSSSSSSSESESSASASSSSSSSSSDDEGRTRKSKGRKKSKPTSKKSKDTKTKSKKSGKADNQDKDGKIMALTPGQIAKTTGAAPSDQLSMNQVMEAAINVASLAADDGDDLTETAPDTFDALQSLVPIGKFLGRKLHEASAKVAQMKEKEQPTYFF